MRRIWRNLFLEESAAEASEDECDISNNEDEEHSLNKNTVSEEVVDVHSETVSEEVADEAFKQVELEVAKEAVVVSVHSVSTEVAEIVALE